MEKLHNIVPMDIETVAFMQWNESMASKITEEEFNSKRNFKAQYAKIIAIAFGLYVPKTDVYHHISLCNDNEKEMLTEFSDRIIAGENKLKGIIFFGHSILDFDIPFIFQRMMACNVKIPDCIKIHTKKAWEIKHIDSHRVWKQGSFGMSITFDDLHHLLTGISGKKDVTGADVERLYKENKLDTIRDYCLDDNLGNERILRRFIELDLI